MTHDVAIIGAGPIGLELAVALQHEGLDVIQFDAGPIGATMHWWAPGTKYFSSPERIEIAGVPLVTRDQEKATREDYLAYLRQVAGNFDLKVRTYTRVTAIESDGEAFLLRTRRSTHGVGGPEELAARLGGSGTTEPSPEAEHRARRVVLAIGDMHVPRLLDVPGEHLPHVSHFFRDPHNFFGRRVLIVGGKNSAVEAALRLYRVGAKVTISYRGERFDPKRIKYWLLPEIEYLIQRERIGFLPMTEPIEIRANDVVVRDADGATHVVEADDVLLLVGYEQDQSLLGQLGVETRGDARAPVFDSKTMETNAPGVFVAGTAAAGCQQRTRLFIENAHVHVTRIVAALAGRRVEAPDPDIGLVES